MRWTTLAGIVKRFADMPFFVITGAAKSGTTWVHKLCSSHPEIRCHGEDDFNQVLTGCAEAMNAYNQDSAERNNKLPHSDFARFGAGDMELLVLAALAIMLGKPPGDDRFKAVGSKFNNMITHNTAFFANILRHARIVHVVRDPRETLVSLHHHNYRGNPDAARARYPELADTVRELGPILRETLETAETVRTRDPANFMALRYEDLKADGPTAAGLFSFIGVDASPQAVAASLDAESFERMSGGRQSGEEDATSFMRKGIVGDWRGKMDAACLRALAETGLQPVIAKLGYPD